MNAFQRHFVNEVKRADDMHRIVKWFIDQLIVHADEIVVQSVRIFCEHPFLTKNNPTTGIFG